MNTGYLIRLEMPAHYREVETLIREAFWNVNHPGGMEHYVLHVLRDHPAFVPELDLVMEKDGKLISHVMYMRSAIHADDGRVIHYFAEPRETEVPYFLLCEQEPGYRAGITGTYKDPAGYFVNQADVDAFDAQFPPREKLKLPGTLYEKQERP